MSFPEWAVPGREVVCINDEWPNLPEIVTRAPMLNEVLTIARLIEGDNGFAFLTFIEIPESWSGVVTVEVPGMGHVIGLEQVDDMSWLVGHFRPLTKQTQEDDVKLFAPLLTIKPKVKETTE